MTGKRRICTAFAVMCLTGVFPAYASETSQVAIELDAETDGAEAYFPKTTAEYRLTLKNKLGPSWVRVKFRFSGKGLNAPFSDENLKILEGWEKHGEYYYYIKKAEARTDIPVTNGLLIPDADSVLKGTRVEVAVDAQAVQYSAFCPDFFRKEPWEGAEIAHTASISKGHSGFTGNTKLHLYPFPQERAECSMGKWEQTDEKKMQWKYSDGRENYVKDAWIYTINPYSPVKNTYSWFHFGKDGIMTVGWHKAADALWYYTSEVSDGNLGMLIKGWHRDMQDGRWYFLDRRTGIMLSGWQEIDGKSYYFATEEDIPRQTWFWKTGLGKWIYEKLGYKSYGCMYMDERTPDGRLVDKNGVRDGKAGMEETG